MRVSLRLSVCVALSLFPLACTQPPAQAKFERIWKVGSDGTLVHRSGIRMSEDAGSFHKKNEFVGEWQDYSVFYARDAEPGGIQVSFSGVYTPAAHVEGCNTAIDRIAGYADRPGRFEKRVKPWERLSSLFSGMEAGKTAIYDTKQYVNGSFMPMRSEIYILCGTGGSWIVQYRADYPPDVDGSTWISELIAATAPRS